jgi:hypothetical protein
MCTLRATASDPLNWSLPKNRLLQWAGIGKSAAAGVVDQQNLIPINAFVARNYSGLMTNRRITYRANEDERIALLSRNERRIGKRTRNISYG